MSVFSSMKEQLYARRWNVVLEVDELHGGIPASAKQLEGWIRANIGRSLGETSESRMVRLLREHMDALGIEGADLDAGIASFAENQHQNVFRRAVDGQLAIERRIVKAMIREAANVSWPRRKWGPTNKGTKSYFVEHVFVEPALIGLGVTEPTGICEGTVHTWRGASLKAEECVAPARVEFELLTDVPEGIIGEADFAELFARAENLGLGASRSQYYGTFSVVKFDLTH